MNDQKGLNTWTQDQLPDGLSEGKYLKRDEEWPNLVKRLGEPRILNHHFFQDVLKHIKQNVNLDNFRYLDAGCGHGNDLRAIKKALDGKGNYLGVDLSLAEIVHGLEFYSEMDGEDIRESINMFGLGDLHDLRHVCVCDEEMKDFTYQRIIKDCEFDLIHMEAVLQASGYGYKTYQEKKESARRSLRELFRVCKIGGQFFGTVNVFLPEISKEQQFDVLREHNDWRFMPDSDELIHMILETGFVDLKQMIQPHEKTKTDPKRKHVVKLSFLAKK